MKNTVRRLLAVAMVLAMVLSVSASALALSARGWDGEKSTDALEARPVASYDLSGMRNGRTFDVGSEAVEEIAADQVVTIMVELAAAPAMEVYDQYTKSAVSYAQTLREKQDAVAAKIGRDLGVKVDVMHNYTLLFNGFAFEGEYRLIEEINKIDGARAFVAAEWDCPEINLFNSTDMVGAINAWDLDYTGEGHIVAIIDTGVMVNHPAFSTNPEEVRFDRDDIEAFINGGQLQGAGASTMTVAKVYYSAKVPFRWNYVKNTNNVQHVYNDHGTHVAGIAAGNGGEIQGVAKDAQIAAMQVFNDGGGAGWAAILSALEDCVVLGVDAANLSLGSPCGFTQYYDSSYAVVFQNLVNAGVNLAMSAGNEYSTALGNAWASSSTSIGYSLVFNPDNGVTGSPSTWPESLGIASVDNSMTESQYIENVATGSQFTYSETDYNQPFLADLYGGQTLDFIYVPGVGNPEDFEGYDVAGKVALIQRGEISFYVKIENAQAVGAIAVIIFNNEDGIINMNLSDGNITVPAVSITKVDGEGLAELGEGQIYISDGAVLLPAPGGGEPSDFSSWGTTSDLKIKPEITAPGGNIYSSTDPRPAMSGEYYQTWSGTSMSAPHVTGGMAIVTAYVEEMFPNATAAERQNLVDCILMSTADPVQDSGGDLAAVRKQGAGLMDLASAVTTTSYLTVPGCARPKLELGDDPDYTGVYEMTFTVNNFGEEDLTYAVEPHVLIEDLTGLAYADDGSLVIGLTQTSWEITDWCEVDMPETVVVPAGGTADVTVTVTLTDDITEYIDYYYTVGAFVEGFIELIGQGGMIGDVNGDGEVNSEDALLVMRYSMNLGELEDLASADVNGDGTVNMADALLIMRYANGISEDVTFGEFEAGTDLNIPFLAYYGDWNAIPMLDSGFYFEDFSWGSNPIDNFIGSNYEGAAYGLGINPYIDTEDLSYYLEDRNAVSPNGDGFLDTADVIRVGLMRNADVAGYQLLDADGNFIENLARQTSVRKDYFSTSSSSYSNLGQSMPMPKWGAEPYANRDIAIRVYAYLSNDGSTTTEPFTEDSFNYFNEWIIPIYVDVTVPEAEVVSFNGGVLTLNVTDDHYVAVVAAFEGEVTEEGVELGALIDYEGLFEEERGAVTEVEFEGVENGDLICLGDYAGNEVVFMLVDGELVPAGDSWSHNSSDVEAPDMDLFANGVGVTVDSTTTPWVSFNPRNPGALGVEISSDANDYLCGTQAGDCVYVISDSLGLYKMDISTGALGTPAKVCNVTGISDPRDMSYNPATNTMYVMDGVQAIYTLDLSTGATTHVVDAAYGAFAMGFDDEGNCYTIESGGWLIKLDLTTGSISSMDDVVLPGCGVAPYIQGEGYWGAQYGCVIGDWFMYVAIDASVSSLATPSDFVNVQLIAIKLDGSGYVNLGPTYYAATSGNLYILPVALFGYENAPFVAPESSVDPVDFYENFEGVFNWELIDADGDDLNWGVDYADEGCYQDGSKACFSYSWLPEPIGAFTPDNYMISPSFEVGEGEKWLSFFTASYNEGSMYEEHLQIIVIPEGYTYENGFVVFDDRLDTPYLTEHLVDLTDFEGETIQLAFRHFDCYDLYTLIVDSIGVGDLK